MIKPSRIFEVFESDDKRKIFTRNLYPSQKYFNEAVFLENNVEYREFDPRRSKLAASIMKGCYNIFIRKNDVVLYLGASHGYTVSYVSDIVGKEGFVFAVDSAPRVVRDLYFLAKARDNIAPILADANNPLGYMQNVCKADVLFQDIAQRNQAEIFLKNVNLLLKENGYALLAVKARSIDVTKKPSVIFRDVRQKLEKEMTVVDYKTLEPYQIDHCLFICKNKKR